MQFRHSTSLFICKQSHNWPWLADMKCKGLSLNTDLLISDLFFARRIELTKLYKTMTILESIEVKTSFQLSVYFVFEWHMTSALLAYHNIFSYESRCFAWPCQADVICHCNSPNADWLNSDFCRARMFGFTLISLDYGNTYLLRVK